MRAIWRLTAAAAVCVALGCCPAAGSVFVHQEVVVGYGCDWPPCRKHVKAAGWPFAYLIDNPTLSAINTFGLEDDVKPERFFVDAAVFGALPTVGVVAVWWRRRRRLELNLKAQLAELRDIG